MDGLFSRYRNLSVLLLLLAGQLLLLAWQIKTAGETRLIRVWAVTAVTPMARGLEAARDGVGGVFQRWFMAGALETENARLRRQAAQLEVRNQLLQDQLQEAGRDQALLEFRSQVSYRSLPSRILGSAPGVQSGVFFIDRGSAEGVKRGMAVVAGAGIVGQVVAAYPPASLIMLANTQGFAAGVISQKNRIRGLLKGDGGSCHVEGIRNEQPVEQGEWFYTSGEDRIFPRGLRVGQVRSVRNGTEGKEIEVRPVALESDVTEVLILLDAVHGKIPDLATPPSAESQVLPAPPEEAQTGPAAAAAPTAGGANPGTATDADRLKDRYRKIVEGQGLKMGVTPYRAPDFNKAPAPPKAAPPSTAQPSTAQPSPTQPPAAEPSTARPAGAPAKQTPSAAPPKTAPEMQSPPKTQTPVRPGAQERQ